MTCAVLQPAHCVHATHSAHDVYGGPVVLVVHVVHDVDRVHCAQTLLAWQLLARLQDGGWDANLGQVIIIFIMLMLMVIMMVVMMMVMMMVMPTPFFVCLFLGKWRNGVGLGPARDPSSVADCSLVLKEKSNKLILYLSIYE